MTSKYIHERKNRECIIAAILIISYIINFLTLFFVLGFSNPNLSYYGRLNLFYLIVGLAFIYIFIFLALTKRI